MESINETIIIAQKIVRRSYCNFNNINNFNLTSGIYRFTNEDISAYFHHLENKKNVLTVIGSGNQILNTILAGSTNVDCFDISIFPEYYLYLHIGAILSLSQEDYIRYFLSEDNKELFSYEIYELIRKNIPNKYRKFWDSLYDYDEGIDIYNSLLFRQDYYNKETIINNNPYLQESNYLKLKNILETRSILINSKVYDIINTKITKKYDLINLSNILEYYYNIDTINEYLIYLKNNFNLNNNGEIINYFNKMDIETIKIFKK